VYFFAKDGIKLSQNEVQYRRVMLEVIAIWDITVIYLPRSVEMLELVGIEVSDSQDRNPQTKSQQDKQENDYSIYGYF
jgi:hypothetical protein